MTPEFGASAGMFYIDEQTIDYLKLTGRDAEQVALVENYAKTTGLWADDLEEAQYERVLTFDLSTVCRNMAGPSNPHRRLPTSDLAARDIAGSWEEKKVRCQMVLSLSQRLPAAQTRVTRAMLLPPVCLPRKPTSLGLLENHGLNPHLHRGLK